MNPTAKRDAVTIGGTVALIGAALTLGIYNADKQLAPARPLTITLVWDKNDTDPATITEVWASTNLSTWTLKTNVSGTNRVTITADKPAEFFKVRNNNRGALSDWARKSP